MKKDSAYLSLNNIYYTLINNHGNKLLYKLHIMI